MDLARTYINQFPNDPNDEQDDHFTKFEERIKVLQLDLSVWKDSTSIELYLRETINLEKMDIPIFVNCTGYGGHW